MKIVLSLVALLVAAATTSHARMVTLVATNDAAHYYVTNEVEVSANEIAELVSFPSYPGVNLDAYGKHVTVEFVKNSVPFQISPSQLTTPANPVVVTGPATIRLIVSGEPWAKGICTWRIEPESFPPDKTVIIPEGTGARIALECSTNLTQWTEVYSAIHTNSPSNKFFRIKAERLQ